MRLLRTLTRMVQLAPFAFLVPFSLYLVCSAFLPEWAVRLADAVFNVPPYAIAGMLGAGRLLKLCPWFRTAVLIPLAAKAGCYVDSFLFIFTQDEIAMANAAIGLAILAFVHCARRHFLPWTRRRYS